MRVPHPITEATAFADYVAENPVNKMPDPALLEEAADWVTFYENVPSMGRHDRIQSILGWGLLGGGALALPFPILSVPLLAAGAGQKGHEWWKSRRFKALMTAAGKRNKEVAVEKDRRFL